MKNVPLDDDELPPIADPDADTDEDDELDIEADDEKW